MEYNIEQLDIINADLSQNVLVSAAAGSGKTTVLSERIARMVSNEIDKIQDVSLSDILVMTFTRKATREMITRIRDKIEARVKGASHDIKDKLIREVNIIQNANIFTIDAFCKKIVDENYTLIDDNNSYYFPFDPNYRIASENEMGVLKEDVLSTLLEEKYLDSEYRHLFDSYVDKTDESVLKSIVFLAINKLSSIPWPIDYLNDLITNFTKYSDAAYANYLDLLYDKLSELKADMLETRNSLSEMMLICKDLLSAGKNPKGNKLSDSAIDGLTDNINFSEAYLKFIDLFVSSNVINLDEEKKHIDEKILKELCDELTRLPKDKPKSVIKTNFSEDVRDKYLTLKDLVCDLPSKYNMLYEIYGDVSASNDIIYNENEIAIYKLLKEYYIRLIDEKKKRNMYEISDYASIALDILYDKVKDANGNERHVISKHGELVASKYKAIFIDEYQDTNYIQEKILEAISDNFNKRNVFMVGDVKQSIYKFRNAEPGIFTQKFKRFKDDPVGKNMLLSTNYRCSKEIVEYVNSLFSKTMIPSYGDIDYKDGNELCARPEEKNRDLSVDKKVLIKVVCKDEENEKKFAGIAYEAEYVASEIERLVKEENYSYKQIVILMRATTGKSNVFVEALKKHRIPAYAEEKTGFFDRLEIKLMLDFLRVIDNPTQNVALASVLLSDVFHMDNNDLAFIKLASMHVSRDVIKNTEKDSLNSSSYDKIKNEDYNLYNSLTYIKQLFDSASSVSNSEIDKFNSYMDECSIDAEDLKSKISKFFNSFNDLQFKARYLNISDLISEIYENYNIKNIVSVMPDGNQRTANLDSLYDFALNFENSSGVGLFNFNRYVEKIKEIDRDSGQAKLYDENADVVRIMTIHAAKGLEFETVFLCSCNTSYNMNDANTGTTLQFDRNYGFALDYRNVEKRLVASTPKKKLLIKKKKDDIRQEELRMLYVALTRAINKLYIVGNTQKQSVQGIKLSDVEGIKNSISTGDFTNIHRDIKDLNSFFEVVLRSYDANDQAYADIEIIDGKITDDVVSDEKADLNVLSSVNSEDISVINKDKEYYENVSNESLQKDLNGIYPYMAYRIIPPKYSVTYLKKLFNEKSMLADEYNNYSEEIDSVSLNAADYMYEDVDDARYDKDASDSQVESGAELGTIYHRFMQKLDFNKYDKGKDCDSEKTQTTNNSDQEFDHAVDQNKISSFLNSKLGKEMKIAYNEKNLYREQRFMQLFSKNDIDVIVGNDSRGELREPDGTETCRGEHCEPENRRGELCEPDVFNDKCIIIQGIIDAFYLKKDENGNDYIVLMDYKTDSINKKIFDEDAFARELIERYKVQLGVYAKVLENLTGYNVKEIYIYSFALDKEIAI